MSNNQPDVEMFEVDADPPPELEQQKEGDLRELINPQSPKRNEADTEPPNEDFTKDLPGRLDED